MILDVLGIACPSIILIVGVINLVASIKMSNRSLVLKDITIIMLSLTLIITAIKQL